MNFDQKTHLQLELVHSYLYCGQEEEGEQKDVEESLDLGHCEKVWGLGGGGGAGLDLGWACCYS